MAGIDVGSGELVDVLAGGRLENANILSGGGVSASGASVQGLIINAGGFVELSHSALASDTTLNGGFGYLISGASAFGTTVNSGGYFQTEVGRLGDTTVNAGGTLNEASSTSDYETVVGSGGVDIDHGTSFGTVISGGGVQLNNGAQLNDVSVLPGGSESVLFGSISGMQLYGIASNFGGQISAVFVKSGGFLGNEGFVSSAVIFSGGAEIVSNGGTALSTDVISGGILIVLPGGEVSGTTGTVTTGGVFVTSGENVTLNPQGPFMISSGSVETLFSGGFTSDTILASNALQILSSGGLAYYTSVNSGAGLTVNGGTSVVATIYAGGSEQLLAGMSISTRVESEGVLKEASGDATYALVSGGGVFNLNYNGKALNTTVLSGGFVSAAGFVSGSTIAANGSVLINGGTNLDAVVSGIETVTGRFEFVDAARQYYVPGITSGDVIVSGGVEFVGANASAYDVTISSGGIEVISSGASADNISVFPGGTLLALPGSDLTNITGSIGSTGIAFVKPGQETRAWSGPGVLSSGAFEYVLSSGYDFGTTLLSGATEIIIGGISSGVIINGGTQLVSAGTAYNTSIADGSASILGGAVVDAVLGSGATLYDNAGTISGDLTFAGSNATVALSSNADLDATIIDFGSGDVINLGVLAQGVPTLNVFGNSVVIGQNTNYARTLNFSNTPNLILTSAMNYDTLLEASPLCFCPGTRIATPHGEVFIEDLCIGDPIITARGEAQIAWVGKSAYDAYLLEANPDLRPIELAPNSIAPNIPVRSLRVSPNHGIVIGEYLVAAVHLVNGVTIRRLPPTDTQYFNIELITHEIIFAESCPSETFLEEDLRSRFLNAAEAPLMPPKSAILPRLESGFMLRRIQCQLAARAGLNWPEHAAEGRLTGFLEHNRGIAAGWARSDTDVPVSLDITVDGFPVTRALANIFRPDLRRAGIGKGFHAFRTSLPAWIGTREIAARRTSDGAPLALLRK